MPVLQWTSGDLANSGESVELSDPYGHAVDRVVYEDGGGWTSVPDGTGPSLELVNPSLPNEYGAAWNASLVTNGTPGRRTAATSRRRRRSSTTLATTHRFPARASRSRSRPSSSTTVVIPTVTLQYRQDQEPTIAYTAVAMFDDGQHGDGLAGDNVYGVVIAGLAEGQRLDFAIQASDGTTASVAPIGHDGVFPGAAGHPPQVYLCKFSSAALPTDFPSYHLLTTQYTRNLQATRDKTEYDATFIRCPASGVATHARSSTTSSSATAARAASSRTRRRSGSTCRATSRWIRRWVSRSGRSHARAAAGAAGSRIQFCSTRQGSPPPSTTSCASTRTRWRTAGPRTGCTPMSSGSTRTSSRPRKATSSPCVSQTAATSTGTTCGGDVDCPAGERCIATDGGNCYRGRDNDASLRWEGFDPDAYRADANERNGYQKITNEDADDWTDLITLCDAMNCSTSDGGLLCLEDNYNGWFQNGLTSYADVEQWARWYAVQMLLDNTEGGIYRDTGDDYFLYFWPGSRVQPRHVPSVGHGFDLPSSARDDLADGLLQSELARASRPAQQRLRRALRRRNLRVPGHGLHAGGDERADRRPPRRAVPDGHARGERPADEAGDEGLGRGAAHGDQQRDPAADDRCREFPRAPTRARTR